MHFAGQVEILVSKITSWAIYLGTVFDSTTYHKIASSNTSCLEAHVGFFRWLKKGIFGPYVL